MNETYQQMKSRHAEEKRIAEEQHEIRMRAMQERHFSEMMQVANPAEKPVSDGKHGTL